MENGLGFTQDFTPKYGEKVQYVVAEIAGADAETLRAEFQAKGVDLGPDTVANARIIDNILGEMRGAGKGKKYLVAWLGGGRVPTGLIIDGKTIAWTQHGIIRDANGMDLGTYERLVDKSEKGADGFLVYKQAMIFYMHKND